jgi:hypothetical protein
LTWIMKITIEGKKICCEWHALPTRDNSSGWK